MPAAAASPACLGLRNCAYPPPLAFITCPVLQSCQADPLVELEAWQAGILGTLPASRPASPPPLAHVSAIIVQLYAHRLRQLPMTGPPEDGWVRRVGGRVELGMWSCLSRRPPHPCLAPPPPPVAQCPMFLVFPVSSANAGRCWTMCTRRQPSSSVTGEASAVMQRSAPQVKGRVGG